MIHGWDAALKEDGGIDFEDMINLAADCLERGYRSPYRLVMADEYQDASRARARLCRVLVTEPHSHLFAVGDDWQSINRFAGADVGVMTGFVDWYGDGEERRLFYVALTRARRSVAMFTVSARNSPFLKELVKDGVVTVTDDLS